MTPCILVPSLLLFCPFFLADLTDASMPQTTLASVSTGFCRITPTITTDTL